MKKSWRQRLDLKCFQQSSLPRFHESAYRCAFSFRPSASVPTWTVFHPADASLRSTLPYILYSCLLLWKTWKILISLMIYCTVQNVFTEYPKESGQIVSYWFFCWERICAASVNSISLSWSFSCSLTARTGSGWVLFPNLSSSSSFSLLLERAAIREKAFVGLTIESNDSPSLNDFVLRRGLVSTRNSLRERGLDWLSWSGLWLWILSENGCCTVVQLFSCLYASWRFSSWLWRRLKSGTFGLILGRKDGSRRRWAWRQVFPVRGKVYLIQKNPSQQIY